MAGGHEPQLLGVQRRGRTGCHPGRPRAGSGPCGLPLGVWRWVARPEPPGRGRLDRHRPDVDAELAARDLPDHLQELLLDLPPDYRAAVVLKDVLSFSYEEIATLKEMPLGTVKNKLFRGRQMLKERLRDFLTD